MAAAMEQLSVSIDQVSDNAREAHRVSNESGVLSADGMQLIQLTAATISRVESDVKTVALTVLDLGQRADSISSIVNTIKEIADQTNLLALNASIEAARAGEQGRGFAVVADEVRKLAERTTASTQEIATVIQQIQNGTRSVVAEIGSSVQVVSEGAQLASQAEDSMRQIKAGSDRVVAAVTDISNALSEQTTASGDIARNVEKIANMAERNETSVSHVADAARDLQQLSLQLQQSVSKIQL
jgi:methyl-accepting chemotaxis protein